jgi:RHS repeat-associated protein
MKKIVVLFSSFLSVVFSFAQPSTDKNFIVVNTIRQQGITTETGVIASTVASGSKTQSIQYFDGLGRQLQTIVTNASPQLKDIISPTEYDQHGRELRKYLPFVNTSQSTNYGSYNATWSSQQPAFYNGQLAGVQPDVSAYSQMVVENSPLNRTLATGAPGILWQPNTSNPYDNNSKSHRIQYEFNTASDAVKLWTVLQTVSDFDIAHILSTSFYGDGQLEVSVGIDEHQSVIKEYRNKDGLVVLKRVQDDIGWIETYYIYDQLKNLRAVIQPEGVANLPSTLTWDFVKKWMFLYRYDHLNRMVMKKVPGADSVVLFYDKWDRLVLTQDGNQRPNRFLFTKYDSFNRPIITGTHTDARPHLTIRNEIMDVSSRFESLTSGTVGYTLNQSYPTNVYNDYNLLTVTYYDTYSNVPWVNSGYSFTSENNVISSGINNNLKNITVASQVKNLEANTWMRTVMYFDDKYRTVQVISDNIFGEKDRVTKRVSFDGLTQEEWSTHNSDFYPGGILTIRKYEYDHTGRLLTISSKIGNSDQVTILKNQYNELGQILNKRLHPVEAGNTSLQQLDYGYNVRGWITNINRVENAPGVTVFDPQDLFAFELNYNTISLGSSVAQFNGNISEQRWKGPLSETPRAFAFTYDKLNRIKTSRFSERISGSWSALSTKYAEDITTYDKNGNIKGLSRYHNNLLVDQLNYSAYDGNRLLQVDDPINVAAVGFTNGTNSGNDYGYDASGNLVFDRNKSITGIGYNYLNLPVGIVFSTPTYTENGVITFTYDAAGNKLKKKVVDGPPQEDRIITEYYYVGSFVYKKSWQERYSIDEFMNPPSLDDPEITPLQPELLMHEEGRIRLKKINSNYPVAAGNASYVYDYFLKDHLGNVRMVITSEQQTDLYAASIEPGVGNQTAILEDALFNNLQTNTARRVTKPTAFDNDANNTRVYKLSGTSTEQIGVSKVLKIMAADKISIQVKSYYNGTPASPATGPTFISDILNILTSGVVLNGGTKGGANASSAISGILSPQLNTFNNNRSYNSSRPKAYINYMYLDEDFNVYNSAAAQIPYSDGTTGAQTITINPVGNTVQKHGYLYVYLTNESAMDVFFDNLIINHERGPVLEEDHYYPFGLTMISLGTQALRESNSFLNRRKFTEQEFDNDLNLNWYHFRFRSYDPQIGRFLRPDPLASKYVYNSTFAYAENKVTIGIDLEGLELLPVNSSWFRMVTEYKQGYGGYGGQLSWRNNVIIIARNVPSIYKDASGGLLFTPNSVGISTSGWQDRTPKGTYQLKDPNRTPGSPPWPWGVQNVTPTNSTRGGQLGSNLDNNQAFADGWRRRAGFLGEFSNWFSLSSSMDAWEASAEIRDNQISFNQAINITKESIGALFGATGIGIFDTEKQLSATADLANFILDGTIPSVNNYTPENIKYIVKLMEIGMNTMRQNRIPVQKETKANYAIYKALLNYHELQKKWPNRLILK